MRKKVPTETWRSSMTIPRELVLVKGVVIILFLLNPERITNYIAKTIKKDSLIIEENDSIR
jgi:levanase/fructan beta-fructosidase